MVASFNGHPSTTIISNSPKNSSDETDLVTFYNKLFFPIRSIPKHSVLTIGGDVNTQIGKNENNKFNHINTTNRNGEHLTDFSFENELTCLNTKTKKRKRNLWTYTYADNAKALIDYIFMNKKCINSALNCEAYSSFKRVSSDQRIVTAKRRLAQRKNITQTTKATHYDWTLLINTYTITLRNKFDALQEIHETLRMKKMRTSSKPILKKQQNAYQTKCQT